MIKSNNISIICPCFCRKSLIKDFYLYLRWLFSLIVWSSILICNKGTNLTQSSCNKGTNLTALTTYQKTMKTHKVPGRYFSLEQSTVILDVQRRTKLFHEDKTTLCSSDTSSVSNLYASSNMRALKTRIRKNLILIFCRKMEAMGRTDWCLCLVMNDDNAT